MESSESSSSPPESPLDLPSRSARSSISEQTRTNARRSKDGNSMRDVARVLIARERETMDLKRTLYTLSEQLKAERQRADAAENKTREVLALFKSANEAKITAEQDAARANEGLRLYKLQYENAQEEIRRAQKLIDALEAQRVDAEESAAKARSTARKLKEERIIMRAREDGRRQGLEEGMAQGRVMGYEEGRTAGYEHGRATAEREFTSAPVTEMDYETPRTREYHPPRVSRPSTSEDSERNSIPNYTQPLDTSAPNPPPVTTPMRMPTPAAAPIIVAKPIEDERTRPIPTRNNFLSPSHPPVAIPPDGWIPQLDNDSRIRVPPPHEMARPPPTSPSPPLSAVLNSVKNIPDEPPAIMIPPPGNQGPDPASRRPRHRRRNSLESESTTMSQFEILGPPSTVSSTARSTTRDRPSVLSAIAEERERTSSTSSPIYGLPNLSTQSFQMPSPTPGMPVPSPSPQLPPQVSPQPQPPQMSPHHPPPQNPTYPDTTPRYRSSENLARSNDDYYRTNTPRYSGAEGIYRDGGSDTPPHYGRTEEPPSTGGPYGRRGSGDVTPRSGTAGSVHRYPSTDNLSRMQSIYAPPHSPHSSPDTPSLRQPKIVVPTPYSGMRPVEPQNRGSMSSGEIVFTVEPPSRPESNISRTDAAERSLLSAEDADRPLPAVPEPDTTSQPPAPSSPVIPSPVLMSGTWPPPGFVPTGPPSPSQGSAIGPAGIPLPPSSYAGSTVGPAGVPLPPSVYSATPSVRSEAPIPGGFPGADAPVPVVIPRQLSSRSSQSGSGRNAKEPYSRSAIKRRDDDSDSSVSSGLGSSDSLTTPPARTRKLSTRSTPAYAAAPIPPTIQYPVAPPTPRSSTSNSLGSHTNRATRVPLPPSVSGSVSGSAVGSAVGGRPPSRSGSAMDRLRSPMMGGGRTLSSPSPSFMALSGPDPVIPIPIPEPQPQFVIPPSPRRPTTPLADMEPVPIIPAVARAPSPVASAVSGTTATTARGKKGGKKKR